MDLNVLPDLTLLKHARHLACSRCRSNKPHASTDTLVCQQPELLCPNRLSSLWMSQAMARWASRCSGCPRRTLLWSQLHPSWGPSSLKPFRPCASGRRQVWLPTGSVKNMLTAVMLVLYVLVGWSQRAAGKDVNGWYRLWSRFQAEATQAAAAAPCAFHCA